MKPLRLIAGLAASCSLLLGSASIAQTSPASPTATRGTGSVVGFVSNAATKLNLEGAIVTVAQLGITA